MSFSVACSAAAALVIAFCLACSTSSRVDDATRPLFPSSASIWKNRSWTCLSRYEAVAVSSALYRASTASPSVMRSRSCTGTPATRNSTSSICLSLSAAARTASCLASVASDAF